MNDDRNPIYPTNASSPLDPALSDPAYSDPAYSDPTYSNPPNPTDRERATLRLLEERLAVNRYRRKVGEVIIRKVVETHMIQVPVRREKLVVEQVSPERKQLASVDLGKGELFGVEFMQATDDVSSLEGRETFISAKTASRILEEIAENPTYRSARVKVVFEDAALQATYEQWLSRHLSENPSL